jgi:hypothetical protein
MPNPTQTRSAGCSILPCAGRGSLPRKRQHRPLVSCCHRSLPAAAYADRDCSLSCLQGSSFLDWWQERTLPSFCCGQRVLSGPHDRTPSLPPPLPCGLDRSLDPSRLTPRYGSTWLPSRLCSILAAEDACYTNKHVVQQQAAACSSSSRSRSVAAAAACSSTKQFHASTLAADEDGRFLASSQVVLRSCDMHQSLCIALQRPCW